MHLIDPILVDVPTQLRTARLLLRTPQPGDGQFVAASVIPSLPELKPWLPWATDDYTLDTAEIWCRKSAGNFLLRTELAYLILTHSGDHVGNVSVFNCNWRIRSCEIGYWLRTSHCRKGMMSEAVGTLVAMLTTPSVGMQRIEIRCDDGNDRSGRVAERCGFKLEGVLRQQSRRPAGELRDMRIYARVFNPQTADVPPSSGTPMEGQ